MCVTSTFNHDTCVLYNWYTRTRSMFFFRLELRTAMANTLTRVTKTQRQLYNHVHVHSCRVVPGTRCHITLHLRACVLSLAYLRLQITLVFVHMIRTSCAIDIDSTAVCSYRAPYVRKYVLRIILHFEGRFSISTGIQVSNARHQASGQHPGIHHTLHQVLLYHACHHKTFGVLASTVPDT